MKQELIQLLQHEDQSNRLIGCWLAWHEGYGTIEIFDNLINKHVDNADDIDILYWTVGDLSFLINTSNSKKSFMFYISKSINYKITSLEKQNIRNTSKDSDKYTKTFNNFKHMFMEYVLSEEQ